MAVISNNIGSQMDEFMSKLIAAIGVDGDEDTMLTALRRHKSELNFNPSNYPTSE
jgi:hypothetical protein